VADGFARILSDSRLAVSPQEFLARGPKGLQCPGLYPSWIDDEGAADLSRGLGQPIQAGLIYARQAGATRWPSGQRSSSTLWARIAGMHLAGAAESSAFRRSLAAILRSGVGLTGEDDPRLSEWMSTHLRVVVAVVSDADRLGLIEAAVLDGIDPPLNLRGRQASPVRARLTQMRSQRQGGRA
jgi:GIY-YIG catalytic domain